MTEKVIKYVGRTTNFKGKSLWEIVGRLKNFGVGRIIVRSSFQRYPELSYMKIVKVETCPNPEEEEVILSRKVRVWVEKTFRGQTLSNITEIHRTSYKPDYQLIPKNEEKQYLEKSKAHISTEAILPRTIEMPPLMKLFVKTESERRGLELPKEYTMLLSYNNSPNRVKRIAKEGEIPTIKFTMALGEPASPSLYEGVKLS